MRNCLIAFIITLFSICSIGRCYVIPGNTTLELFANISITEVPGDALDILTDGFRVTADLTVYQVAHMLYTRTPYVLNDSVVFLDNNGNILASGGAEIEGDPEGQSIRLSLTEAQADAVNQVPYIYEELEQDIFELIADTYSSVSDSNTLERRGNPLNYICGFNLNYNSCKSYKNCNRERSAGSGKKCGCLKAGQMRLCLTYKP
ncbi:hypothetical protein HG536_0D01280 [Torulaspora globosa]|uniref:Uncharacterized protein n=1 Tax=Torulaspora globosa TaxID=48254 RepID=A0A7G3ZGH0_9SACH|nr:uncharacterized protein HG536_0D01280 [Torulaspora globosa]QLL32606.1 hypothetical protein HG536_0D01280 [Torulaspora globosa]